MARVGVRYGPVADFAIVSAVVKGPAHAGRMAASGARSARRAGIPMAIAVSVCGCADLPRPAAPPTDPQATTHYNAGTDYLRTRKYDLAIRELERSIAIEPTSSFSHLSLGVAHYFQGCDYGRAVATLQRATELGRDNHGLTRFLLASALYAEKRFGEAVREYEKAEWARQPDPSIVFRYVWHPHDIEVAGHQLAPPLDSRRYNPAFFLRVMSMMRMGKTVEAKTLLTLSNALILPLTESDRRIVDYLLGKLSSEQLLSIGPDQGAPWSFAHLVVAIDRLAKKDESGAERILTRLMERNDVTSFFHSSARINLEHFRERVGVACAPRRDPKSSARHPQESKG